MIWVLTFIVVGLSLIVRFVFPHLVLFFINKKLATMNGYIARVGNLSIGIIKSTLLLKNIKARKQGMSSDEDGSTLDVESVLISFRWSSLFRKQFIGKILVERLVLTFVNETLGDEQTSSSQKIDSDSEGSHLRTILLKAPLFNIAIEIQNSEFRYIDRNVKPGIDMLLYSFHFVMKDFSNMGVYSANPSKINARGNINEGILDFNMKLFPLAEYITFDLNLQVKDTDMVLLNDFFRTYARIDVNHGTFDLYAEIAAREGMFKGYVKPVMKDIDIVGAEDQNDGFFRRLWERLVAVVVQTLENSKGQITTKIPIEGKLNDPHINIFSAVGGILKNAFIQAIRPSFDNAISIKSIAKAGVLGTKKFIRKRLAGTDVPHR